MRHSRITACASSLLLAAACTFTGAATAQARPQTAAKGYVALGDSYAAGVGAGSYLASSGDCLRSRRAHPHLWAAAHAPSSFSFTACNGARTTDVLARQLGPLNARTGLVSITVGGSDSGFSDVLTTCVLRSTSACLTATATARSFMDKTLPRDLDRLYTAIGNKAPAAHVVVLGYPHLYKLNGTCVAGLAEKARSALNNAVDHLNGVIAKRAADHGFTFADVRAAFTGHEICSAGPSWMRSVNWLAPTESYHPTDLGQSRGFLPVFTSAA
ncbi:MULTISPECIES: SGNH/GDSL hydrolase family protein [Streptomyces]|uniref:SGNH/GDSL hydrolase family protein n=1 Tax=Streptomyces dengpaensis TaxID=2049881 RepID=A0ABM6T0N5_9ACTN|nr:MULTISPECIES: SGNH/GDSL hydrolase family protein [Streptomyces]AVH60704.1 SGNH/GDSL hydrolase family protein [Streptomyces dengpaensis]PIB03617.1 lipase [Streptomyces sp. HG99]